MSRLVTLCVGGSAEPWSRLGLQFSGPDTYLSDVRMHVVDGESGLFAWEVSSPDLTPGRISVDGITTVIVPETPAPSSTSPLGPTTAVRLDHVVVNTNDLDRTSAALESHLLAPARRTREVGNGVFQRFHMLDNTIIEVVCGPHITATTSTMWGMVASVDDIHELCGWLGPDVASAPKPAVQKGRYISTVKPAVGLGVPFAIMSPHVRPTDAE
jgi:hypothetical protein